MFKPHHLELFYYVARHGGISAAARHIPYGIGQPAISGQMTDFERQLGARLFERKPFQLTEPGRQLYAHLGPFYDGLDPLWRKIRGGPTLLMRIAADDMISHEFLPAIIAAAAPRLSYHAKASAVAKPTADMMADRSKDRPGVCIELQTGQPDVLETGLHERRIHFVITATDRRIPGVRSLVLARPGLQLLVPRKTRINSPGHFWQQGRIAEPLICPVEAGAVQRTFERGLQALHVEWPTSIRVNSTAVMMKLVAGGHGVGVSLALPSRVPHPEVRALPLAGFGQVPVVALWRPPARPWLESLLPAVRDTARRLWPAALLTGPWMEIANRFIDQVSALAE